VIGQDPAFRVSYSASLRGHDVLLLACGQFCIYFNLLIFILRKIKIIIES
jgi:hypothetical protein